MSWFDDRREERRRFENDVFYDAWSRGLDPDRATRCADDCFDEGRSARECVDDYASQVRAEQRARQEREAYEMEQLERAAAARAEYEQHLQEQEAEERERALVDERDREGGHQ